MNNFNRLVKPYFIFFQSFFNIFAIITQYVHKLRPVFSHRTVFSTRSTTTLHFVCSMQETYVLIAVLVMFVIDGISHLMAQNVQNQRLLKELFTFQLTRTPYRHRQIEGYCNQVPKGHVRVGFWVGWCEKGFSLGEGSAGWYSISHIVIEEVPPPQA